ncbi:MAG: hypothetical protein KAJ49_05810 [Arcobacteraceae bacterium]|nr:hypothetical protein [Arcobacteraceae bacterium]
MKILIITALLFTSMFATKTTPSEVYAQTILISDEIHFLLKHYNVYHDHEGIIKTKVTKSKVKPRNSWQRAYEIMIKINILRNEHNLPIIEPVNMTPNLNVSPDLVYEQTQRILTEIKIFKFLMGLKSPEFKVQTFKGKVPTDVFNSFWHISESFDELNKGGFTTSYVFGENMRIYDDLTTILQHLNIKDVTIPSKLNRSATSTDTFNTGMEMLSKIKQLQIKSGIDFVDFVDFKKKKQSASDVFTITQMIIAELQTLKAHIGLDDYITPGANKYNSKTPIEVDQLINWNLRKLSLINSLEGTI